MKRVLTLAVVVIVLGAPASRATVPSTLNGLSMKAESVDNPKHPSKREYLRDVQLYSLRKGKQLEATLEFGRFRSGAPVSSLRFQRSIAAQLGTTVPIEQRLGGATVFLSKAKSLTLVSWVRDRRLTILSIRTDYATPKTLIRSALDLEP
jgi:hypothetical protein